MALKKLVAGNWKMHGVAADLEQVRAIAEAARRFPAVDVALVRARDPDRARGAGGARLRDRRARTSTSPRRARTPAASRAAMLIDAGASLTIVGHTERREAQRESDAEVKAKAEAALAAGLAVILCVGESLEVREAGEAVATVVGAARRLRCPAASPMPARLVRRLRADLGDRHRQGPVDATTSPRCTRRSASGWSPPMAMRATEVRILYGGSVKASNAAEIFAVRRRRRRAGRRRQPEGRGLPADRRGRGRG